MAQENSRVKDLPSELLRIINTAEKVTLTQSTTVADRTTVTCLTVLYEEAHFDSTGFSSDCP